MVSARMVAFRATFLLSGSCQFATVRSGFCQRRSVLVRRLTLQSKGRAPASRVTPLISNVRHHATRARHVTLHTNPEMSRIASPTRSFCAWEGDVLVLNILGTPSAKKDAIGKAKGHQLKVSVTAAPVAGRATDHMVKFLAQEFGVTTKDIVVVFGRFNVNKQLRITSPKSLPSVVSKELSLQKTDA